MKLSAIIQRENQGSFSLRPELDDASQGDTVDEARSSLKVSLDLFFESASLKEIQQRLSGEIYIAQIEAAFG